MAISLIRAVVVQLAEASHKAVVFKKRFKGVEEMKFEYKKSLEWTFESLIFKIWDDVRNNIKSKELFSVKLVASWK